MSLNATPKLFHKHHRRINVSVSMKLADINHTDDPSGVAIPERTIEEFISGEQATESSKRGTD